MAHRLEMLEKCTGFRWDAGNSDKNWERHRVSKGECEQVFFNEPFWVVEDKQHSQRESRYFGVGRTNGSRPLFVVCTIRGDLVRITSARDMSRRERRVYEQAQEE